MACQPTGCVGQIFCEPSDPVTSPNWSYVGHGRGSYEQEEVYNYVGEGSGSYRPEKPGNAPINKKLKKECIIASCCLLVTFVVLSAITFVVHLNEGSQQVAAPVAPVAPLSKPHQTPVIARSSPADWEPKAFKEKCHTSQEGEICYEHVLWALESGFQTHPEWYPSLDSESTFEEFQQVLHEGKHWSCPPPCGIQPEAKWRIHQAMTGEAHAIKGMTDPMMGATNTYLAPHVHNAFDAVRQSANAATTAAHDTANQAAGHFHNTMGTPYVGASRAKEAVQGIAGAAQRVAGTTHEHLNNAMGAMTSYNSQGIAMDIATDTTEDEG